MISLMVASTQAHVYTLFANKKKKTTFDRIEKDELIIIHRSENKFVLIESFVFEVNMNSHLNTYPKNEYQHSNRTKQRKKTAFVIITN